ncbi:alcohol dehydrogenase catalytic domain-containing protein [Alisedimentitalea sp. MJ-SS2]|uniref:quinone oxidoreductase family protein n=1 Tax=Aliisedimentitalea sp. MJ-SS2 TaxID=3049795 RepID=UPI0029111BFF|nr:alcohol dehydrogenase catalytic domain-containing protein [Alisedimentitalea sp. MJ-SS2]MDU8928822.1 alcohol dehydrogenase catalytic domain-containing protein [Alisedimentitalea sp. MJ-SS2]
MADTQTDMKAVICTRYGGPDVLALGHVRRIAPGPGQIEIAVQNATVNRTDTATLRAHPFFARGMTGWLRPRHKVPGMDFAGVVARVGDGVERFAVGDRVFGMSPERFGTYAEFLVIEAEGPVATLPDGVALDEAVICEGAWYASATVNQLKSGQSLLIYGASGAIGTAALQLAKARCGGYGRCGHAASEPCAGVGSGSGDQLSGRGFYRSGAAFRHGVRCGRANVMV